MSDIVGIYKGRAVTRNEAEGKNLYKEPEFYATEHKRTLFAWGYVGPVLGNLSDELTFDWKCDYCLQINPSVDYKCINCGAGKR